MKFLNFLYNITLILCSLNFATTSKISNVIKQLLYTIEQPIKITAMVCWNLNQKHDFTREFFNGEKTNNCRYDIHQCRHFQFGFINPVIDDFPNVQDEFQNLIIVDIDCKETKGLLQRVGMKLTHNFKWIILQFRSDFENDERIYGIFNSLRILPNSQVFYLTRVKNNNDGNQFNHFRIIQVYKTSMMLNNVIIESYGIIRNNTFIDQRKHLISSRSRRNLMKILLRATSVVTNNDTLNHLDDYRDKHIDTISKVNYHLTNYLVESINATLVYSYVQSWGYIDSKTNKWNGMIGDLVDNRSDIGASALFFTIDRIPFLEYIAMPSPTRSKFVFRSPKLSYTDNVYILPFHKNVWYSFFAFIIITSFALSIAAWIEWKAPLTLITTKANTTDLGLLGSSYLEAFIIVIGAACQQGSSVSPKSLTARTIMIMTFILLMFLYTSYSANIVALLQSPSTKIRTLEDLLNARLKFGADDTVFNRYYFSHETEPTRRKIYEEKILQKDGTTNFMPLNKGVEKLRDGLFAFHMELGVGYKLVSETFYEDEKCGLQEIQYLQVIDPWYAIQKNSSYKEVFKIRMMLLHEHGIQERENSKLYTKKPKCDSGNGNFITASLIDVRSALTLLISGYLVSLITIFIEILISEKFCNRIKMRKI